MLFFAALPDVNFLSHLFQALEPSNAKLNVPHQEVVLMVGIQGSGKSHFSEKTFGKAGYVIVSNDKTGGKEKSLSLMKKSLSDGKSVVVDNTHVNSEVEQNQLCSLKEN